MADAIQIVKLWKVNPYDGKCYMRVSDMVKLFECEGADIEKYSAQLPDNGCKAYWNATIGGFARKDGFSPAFQELCLSYEGAIKYLKDREILTIEVAQTLSESYRIAIYNIS